MASTALSSSSKITNFNIVLEKAKPVYYSGETISGVVSLTVLEGFRIAQLKLVARGSAKIYWITNRTTKVFDRRAPLGYKGERELMYLEAVFLNRDGVRDVFLNPGEYVYRFYVPLPGGLPTSFDFESAKIRYTLTATIIIPWATDIFSLRTVTVINNLDLNINPVFGIPNVITKSKQFGALCCKSKPLTISLMIRKSGWVPGEVLMFDILITNQTSSEIDILRAHFIQLIRIQENQNSKILSRYVTSIGIPKKVAKKTVEKINNVSLLVPPLCPTTIGLTDLIEITYMIQFQYNSGSTSLNSIIEMPVVIGTIPVDEKQAPLRSEENSYFSFEPSVFGSSLNNELSDDFNGQIVQSDEIIYTPLYPFYRF